MRKVIEIKKKKQGRSPKVSFWYITVGNQYYSGLKVISVPGNKMRPTTTRYKLTSKFYSVKRFKNKSTAERIAKEIQHRYRALNIPVEVKQYIENTKRNEKKKS